MLKQRFHPGASTDRTITNCGLASFYRHAYTGNAYLHSAHEHTGAAYQHTDHAYCDSTRNPECYSNSRFIRFDRRS